MPTPDWIVRNGEVYIQGLRNTVQELWKRMCEEDGIPPDSRFVIFSPDNKYQPLYNNALQELWNAQAQFKAGGYVGLKIVGGRATFPKRGKRT